MLSDYQEFQEVSIQYQSDAKTYGNNMNQVREAIGHLTRLTEQSADALNGIKDTVSESAAGVTDIAEKTSGMVTKTAESNDMVKVCYGCADNLKDIVAKFKLQ